MTRSGRRVASAMSATESALVLVARITLGSATSSSVAEDGPLQREILDRGLDDQVGIVRQAVDGRDVAHAVEPASHPVVCSVRVEAELRRHVASGRRGSAPGRARWPPRRRRRGRPRSRPRARPGRSPRPSSRHRRCRRSARHWPMTPGRARPSDRFDRFERLAAVGAVADGPALGRPEEVLDDRSARTAVRAGTRGSRSMSPPGRSPALRARRRDARGKEGGAARRADPLGGPRDLERGRRPRPGARRRRAARRSTT